MAKKKGKSYVMELAVTFGNVNIGDKTARIGATCGRPALSLTQADKNLCDRRLIGSIVKLAGNGEPDQNTIPGLDGNEWEVEGAFDVKGFNVSKKAISFGLTFAIESIKVEDLAHFAKAKGVIRIDEIGEIPEEEKEDDADPKE